MAALLPLLVFGGITISRLDAQRRETVETTLRQGVRSAMQAVDRQLAKYLAMMTALAAAPSLDRGDTAAFRLHAGRLLREDPQWLAIQLVDTATGAVVEDLRQGGSEGEAAALPIGGAIPVGPNRRIGGVRALPGFPEPVVTFWLPVTHGGAEVHYAVMAAIGAATFTQTLAQQPQAGEWVLGLLDQDHRIVGRTRAAEQFVGLPATATMIQEIEAAERESVAEKFFFSVNKEGERVYSAFSRSPTSHWTATVGIPAAAIEEPIRQMLMASLAGGLGTALLAIGLVTALMRSTARRQMAERQLEAEQRLSDIAMNFPGVIFRRALHSDGTMQYRYIGGQVGALIGKVPFDLSTPAGMERFGTLIHRDDIPRWRKALARSAKRLEPYRVEGRLLRSDGSVCWVRSAANIHREPDGTLIWDGVVLDITDVRAAESERALLAAIVASASDGIFSTDLEDRVVTWNAAAAQIYGLPAEQVIGKSTAFLLPEELSAERRDLIERIRQGDSVVEHETYRYRQDGSRIEVSLTISPIRQGDGKLVGFSTIVRDISERKRAETELRRSLSEREALLQEVHHRVKNNLQVIAAMVQLEIPQAASEEVRARMAAIARRVQAMGRVHEQLYTSRDLGRIDFGEYLDGLARGLAELHTGQPVTLETDIEPGGVSCDLDRAVPLGLIANELITNAFKHAFPDGQVGTVRVGLRRLPGGVMELWVEDDGVGGVAGPVAKEGAERRLAGMPGGMGMTLIRALVRQTRAELRFEPGGEAGNGTRAIVQLALSP